MIWRFWHTSRCGEKTESQNFRAQDPYKYLGVILCYLHFIDKNNKAQGLSSSTSQKQSIVRTQTSFVWPETYAIWGTLFQKNTKFEI